MERLYDNPERVILIGGIFMYNTKFIRLVTNGNDVVVNMDNITKFEDYGNSGTRFTDTNGHQFVVAVNYEDIIKLFTLNEYKTV